TPKDTDHISKALSVCRFRCAFKPEGNQLWPLDDFYQASPQGRQPAKPLDCGSSLIPIARDYGELMWVTQALAYRCQARQSSGCIGVVTTLSVGPQASNFPAV